MKESIRIARELVRIAREIVGSSDGVQAAIDKFVKSHDDADQTRTDGLGITIWKLHLTVSNLKNQMFLIKQDMKKKPDGEYEPVNHNGFKVVFPSSRNAERSFDTIDEALSGIDEFIEEHDKHLK